jgi:hypothetical protein
VAAAVLLELHVIGRPVRTLPLASFSVAVACVELPPGIEEVPRVTRTDATGATITFMVADPLCPSLVAVMVALPTPTAVKTPEGLTTAAAELLDVHVTTRPDNTLLPASFSVAVACVVPPVNSVELASATVTDATGATETVTLAEPVWPSLVAVMRAAPVPAAVT